MSDSEPEQPETERSEEVLNTPKELPIFPLNVVLFPGMPLRLQIFEARYLEMVEQCLERDRLFGVVLIEDGLEVGGRAEVTGVGTVARIETVERLPDGRLALLTVGLKRFRVLDRLPDNPYPRAIAEGLPEPVGEPVAPALIEETQDLLLRYLQGLAHKGGQEWEDLELPPDPVLLGYVAGAVLPCSLPEKQQILAEPSIEARLANEIPMLRQEVARQKVSRTSSGRTRVLRAHPFEPEISVSPN